MKIKTTLFFLGLYSLAHLCFYTFFAISYADLRQDPSMGAFSYAMKTAQTINTIQAIVFIFPIITLFVKREIFREALIATVVICIAGSFYSEYITAKNAAALSFSQISVLDMLSISHIRYLLEPLILVLALFKFKYINGYFSGLRENAS